MITLHQSLLTPPNIFLLYKHLKFIYNILLILLNTLKYYSLMSNKLQTIIHLYAHLCMRIENEQKKNVYIKKGQINVRFSDLTPILFLQCEN